MVKISLVFIKDQKQSLSLCVFPVEHMHMQACVGIGVCGPLSHCNRVMNERKIPLSIFNNVQIGAASGAAYELKLNFVLSLLGNKRADFTKSHVYHVCSLHIKKKKMLCSL